MPHSAPTGTRRKLLELGAILAAIAALGWLVPVALPAFHLDPLKLGLTYAIVALGLNLMNGMAGQFSIGHAAFAAIGGYTAGAVTTLLGRRLLVWPEAGTPDLAGGTAWGLFVGGLLAGALVAALFGFLVGVPTLRLRGDYLAIATLGFGEIVRVVITNCEPLGGALGLAGIPTWSSFPVVAVFAVLTIAASRNIARSMPGRCLIALREDEIAAESLGISTTRARVTAMTLSAGIAGLGGGLLAHHLGTYHPSMCDWIHSVEFILMVVLGGGSTAGTVVAALFLAMLPGELSQFPAIQKVLGNKMVIYSLLLVLIMLTKYWALPTARRLLEGRAKRKGAGDGQPA